MADIRGVPIDMVPHRQTYRGGASPIRLPDGSVVHPPSRQPVVLPYYIYKPPAGQDLYYNVTGILPAGAGSTVILASPANSQFFVRPQSEGVVAGVNIFVNAPTTDIDVDWTLRFNEGPVQGWSALTTFPRNATSISISFPGNVEMAGNTLVDVLVTNNNAFGPWTVGVEVAGWQWPLNDRLRVFGEDY